MFIATYQWRWNVIRNTVRSTQRCFVRKKNLALSCQIIYEYMLWTWSGHLINENFLIMAVFDVTKIPDVTSQCLHIWNVHRTSGSVGTWVIMPSKQMIAVDGPAGALYHLSSRAVIMVLIPHAYSLLRNCSIWGPIPRSQPPNKEAEWMRFISELEVLRPFREYRLQAVSCSHWRQCQEWVMGNVVNVKWQSDRYIQIGPGARPSCLMSTGRSFCVELSNGSLKVTGHLHVMLRSRKYGAVPPSSLLSLQRVVRTRQDKVSFTSHPVAQTSFCSVLHAWTVDLLSLSFIIT